MSGRFIVFEGPDGSGTTRHSQFLAEKLEQAGIPTLRTAEPTDGSLGQTIRTVLQQEGTLAPDTLQLLFCADRAEHIANTVLPALERGKTVISDRYTLSTIVYGSVMGVDKQWLQAVNEHFPRPDLTILTLPPYQVCVERLGRRSYKDAFESESLQKRIYEEYARVEDPDTVRVNTDGPKQVVADRVYQRVVESLGLPLELAAETQ